MKTLSLLLGTAALFLGACNGGSTTGGDGPLTTQDRQVPSTGATALEIEAPLNLHIRIGDEAGCRLKGPVKALGRLRTEMEGATLRISANDKLSWSSGETVEAWITIPHLQRLHTAGAGTIVVDGRIEEPSVELDLSGATNLDLASIKAGKLDLQLSGTGNVLIRGGEVAAGRYAISGSGNIDAFDLHNRSAEVSVAGAGRAALTATERLDASISGAGIIRYKGKPAITKNVSGIGTLQDAN